ncbi:B12-binding domain-containing radical SAM protein [Butyrivibrio sp. AE3009]|uniref:B12-binding domain-containing radical SAM protein n=1 Tax=Butyrivibrio sp. AE3009 TaxID=1280666 RepID=UPI0003B65D70|nr:radical SAM protein [Butyrivibrio sp. AE3009]
MKVFFVNPPFKSEYGKFSREQRSPAITKSGCFYYPLWLIYAAARLEKEGFEVEFLDAPAKQLSEEDALEIIKAKGADTRLFVVDSTTPSIYNDVSFAGKIKNLFPSALLGLVGTHVSVRADETLDLNEAIDFVARKEYDLTIEDIAKALKSGINWKTVKGITYRESDGRKISNDDMPYITDMDSVPFASEFIKSHLDVKDYFQPVATYPEIQIFTGRGCPFYCNFCLYPQTMHGHQYRYRSPQNIVAEFEYIVENFPEVKEVVIEDDTFTADVDRVKKFCSLIREKGINKKIRWMCNSRVTLDYETMVLMKKAGCRLLLPGFESGSQQILNNIKKGTKVEQFKPFVDNARKAGMQVHGCFIVGNKGETRNTMKETLNVALTLKLDTAQFYPLMPFPGTEAYDWAVSQGYLSGKYTDYLKEDGNHNTSMHIDDISAEELVEFCNYCRRKFYLRPWYIGHRMWMSVKSLDDMKRSLKAFGRFKEFLFKRA